MKFTKASGDSAGDTAASWSLPPVRAAALTRLTKAALWGMVACGPLALLTAAAARPAAGTLAVAPAAAQRSSTGPSGWAELYVAAYLSAGDDTLHSYFPQAPPVLGAAGRRQATRTVALAATEVAPGYWSVTVAADVTVATGRSNRGTGIHYFVVPVLALGGRDTGGTRPSGAPAGFVAAALPAEVSAPGAGAVPELRYNATSPIVDGPLQETVTRFLTAYLTGGTDLDRYLTPSTALTPVQPAPYRAVQTTSVSTREQIPGVDTAVPADGSVAHVLTTVDAVDEYQQHWPLTYALTLTARAGRWEVTRMENAPALAPADPARSTPAITTGSPAPAWARAPAPGTPAPPTGGTTPDPTATP